MRLGASNTAHDPTQSHDSVELQSLLPSNQTPASLPGSSTNRSVSATPVDSVRANMASNVPAVPKKSHQKYSRWHSIQRYCDDSWILEFAAILVSVSATVAIAVVLKAFE